jgi:hypothetical protein
MAMSNPSTPPIVIPTMSAIGTPLDPSEMGAEVGCISKMEGMSADGLCDGALMLLEIDGWVERLGRSDGAAIIVGICVESKIDEGLPVSAIGGGDISDAFDGKKVTRGVGTGVSYMDAVMVGDIDGVDDSFNAISHANGTRVHRSDSEGIMDCRDNIASVVGIMVDVGAMLEVGLFVGMGSFVGTDEKEGNDDGTGTGGQSLGK